jgi:ubiquinone/menaquinone biosynthesis C-methylase UbiE
MREYCARRAPEYDDWYDRVGRYDDPTTNVQWHVGVAELGRIAATFCSGSLPDIACGTGRWTSRFAANPRVTSVTALDRSPEMLAVTRSRLQAAELTATLVEGDAYALPFPAANFDARFFGFLLSHVSPDAVGAFLREMRRVLRPAGHLLLFASLLPPRRPAVKVQRRPLPARRRAAAASRIARCGGAPACAVLGAMGGRCQRLIQIGDQIVYSLDANRETQ